MGRSPTLPSSVKKVDRQAWAKYRSSAPAILYPDYVGEMIDYARELNPAQLEAVERLDGPVLVVAGAGSGKTRTIVYRLARLLEAGIPASSILLLTFTRKAAQEMLERARGLLAVHASDALSPSRRAVDGVTGGTFHSFAYSVLRVFQPEGFSRPPSIMDGTDMPAALQQCREALGVGKKDKSFPKNQTVLAMLSKARNKELALEEVLRREAFHLLPHVAALTELGEAYAVFKREKALLDYDDLLFELERALAGRPEVAAWCRNRYRYLMVDEYQDTNPVQARIAALTAGAENPNLMVVGDDAQSIYAFRGADVRNILRFPEEFPGTAVIRLEENYRSTRPVLDLANAVMENASEAFKKHLFTRREGGALPNVIRPLSDRSQAGIAVNRIVELLRRHPAGEIAVLFRSGFHSYHLELELNKIGLRFRKYGGIRYAEAAHVKDVMSYVRLLQNPLDFPAFARLAGLADGVGPKTCLKLYNLLASGDRGALMAGLKRFPDVASDLAFIDELRALPDTPARVLDKAVNHYRPRLEANFPDDHPKRLQGLEQLVGIAASYTDLDLFTADLSLDEPLRRDEEQEGIVLSTIHSAKGLEWKAVLILDLVEDRFPSRHSLARSEDFEEERRLMYVACTRAAEHLDLFVPASVYDRSGGGALPAVPSPFVREVPPGLYTEWRETYSGALVEASRTPSSDAFQASRAAGTGSGAAAYAADAMERLRASQARNDVSARKPERAGEAEPEGASVMGRPGGPALPPEACGFCRHKIFGRGKIVQFLPPDKYRVNFPGIGLKVIMAAYLSMEEQQ